VIGVFGYLLRTSFRNRLTRRIRRLREPRYLVPFAVSILWFWNFVFRPIFFGNRHFRVAGMDMLPPDWREAFTFVIGLVIFIWIALLWILPDKKAALQFSPAELHFLFPAPITRRQLVQYKLLQAMIGIGFGSLIASFFFGGARFTHAGGWVRLFAFWLFFAIGHLHGIGASFVRTDLMEAGWSGVRRRAISIVVVLLFVFGVFLSARNAWMTVGYVLSAWVRGHRLPDDVALVSTALAQAGSHGVGAILLWPFLALPRLLLSTRPDEFLFYGAVGLVILLLHYLWVIHTDTSFEEASLEISQKAADRREARKRTRRTGGMLVTKAAPFPWKLKPMGRPEIALVWKNAINVTRVTPIRALFALFAFLIGMVGLVMARLAESHENPFFWVGVVCVLIAAFTTVLGAIFLRNDLREDLFRIDSIKTMPLAGHQIVWGEVLGAWSALALIQVIMIVIATVCFVISGAEKFPEVSRAWFCFGGAASLLVLPAITLAAVTLQNAMVVVFPAWVSLGNSRVRGFEASGQRILTMVGSVTALSLIVLPAAASGGVATWLLAPWIGPACLLVGAVIAAAWMWGEVVFGCRLLGGMVDRLDPSTAGIEAQDD